MVLHFRQRSRLRREAAQLQRRRRTQRRARIRAWVRPVLLGAGLAAGVSVIRAVAVVPSAAIFGRWDVLGHALHAMLIAALGGACGGLCFLLVGAPLRRVPWIGPYLAGVVTVAGYGAAVLWGLGPATRHEVIDLGNPLHWIVVVLVTLVYGVVVGRELFRAPDEAAT
jgi:hypothetical protein